MELTEDELKVMKMMHTELTADEIADELNMRYYSFQAIVARLCRFYRVRGRVGLVRMALLNKIISINDLKTTKKQSNESVLEN